MYIKNTPNRSTAIIPNIIPIISKLVVDELVEEAVDDVFTTAESSEGVVDDVFIAVESVEGVIDTDAVFIAVRSVEGAIVEVFTAVEVFTVVEVFEEPVGVFEDIEVSIELFVVVAMTSMLFPILVQLAEHVCWTLDASCKFFKFILCTHKHLGHWIDSDAIVLYPFSTQVCP